VKLRLYPDEALSSDCMEVEEFNSELHEQLDQMTLIMREQRGLGLAANQVGILKRFFIMENLVWVFNKHKQLYEWAPKYPVPETIELINPIMTKMSEEDYRYREGCLSAPSVYEWVSDRSTHIVVQCQDRTGASKTYATSEVMSVCVQHEIDHLDGMFFFDRLPRVVARAARKRWKKKRRKLGL